MTEEQEEEETLNKLNARIDERTKKMMEEMKKQDAQENLKNRPYAVCDLCNRILTKAQYTASNCEYCGGTKGTIIHWDNPSGYTTTPTTTTTV